MIDYDTLAEAIFRERALRNAADLARQAGSERPVRAATPRRRVAGLLLTLASWLAPATTPASTPTSQRAS